MNDKLERKDTDQVKMGESVLPLKLKASTVDKIPIFLINK